MKKDIKKEVLYSLRSSRFLIIAATFLFFGILTPVMTKFILPAIFQSQFPGVTDEMMAEMVDMSQLGSLKSFFNDMFEMGTLVIAFSLCGLLAQELKDNTLVIPLCSGKRFSRIVLSKLIVFSAALSASVIIAVSVSYLYAGALFAFDVPFLAVMKSGLLQSFYLIFILSCLLFFGSLIKKPIAAGFITLFTAFGLQAAGNLLDINSWLPSGLVAEAQTLSDTLPSNTLFTLLITAVLIAAMTGLTIIRLQTIELNER